MCLGVPLKIVEINRPEAVGEMNGIRRKVRVDLLPELELGDYVMVHAGFAIEKIDETLAQETIEAIMEVAEAANE
jgi:hydrogenase expression/formation protein HypC